MECQSLFSGKKKKNIVSLSSAEVLSSMLSSKRIAGNWYLS